MTPEIITAISKAADMYGLDKDLVTAIVMTESSGDPNATRYEPAFYKKYIQPHYKDELDGKRRATSWGLMQIMGQVARELGYKGPFNQLLSPDTGLEWGCAKLRQCMKKWGGVSQNHAIAAYNAGTPRMKGLVFANQNYVDKVNKNLSKVKGEGNG
jgi:soluble lytic murein transglycosylase-like protein